ncbi:MAG: hypothetical protein KDI31_16765, partial [Pseudomonadales bacterium]|nr:hypothetical protein [Pseudomonadales bacterium]
NGAFSRAELEALSEFADKVARTTPDEPAYDPAILDRVMNRLDEVVQDEAEAPLVVRESVDGAGSNWFADLIERLQWSATPRLARIAIGAQFALLVGLTVALTSGTEDASAPGNEAPGNEAPGYATVAAGEMRGDLTLRFVDGTTEAQIRSLLLAAQASIVAGPSALGIYTVAIGESGDRQAAVALISDSPLTDFVQPVLKP